MDMSAMKRVDTSATRQWRNATCSCCGVVVVVTAVTLVLLGTTVQCFQPFVAKSVSRRQNRQHPSQLQAIMMDLSDLTAMANWVSHHSTGSTVDDTTSLLSTNSEVVSSLLSTMISATAQAEWDKMDPNHVRPYLGSFLDKYYSYSEEQLDHLTYQQRWDLLRMVPLSDWIQVLKIDGGHEQQLQAWHEQLYQAHKHNLEETISIRPSRGGLRALGLEDQSSTAPSNGLLQQASEIIKSRARFDSNMHNDMRPLDGSQIVHGGDASFPGFVQTRSILAPHVEETVRPDSPTSFVARMRGAGTILPVIDKLPFVAFYYALVEFFFLRPNVDLYKEEVEDDPAGVTAETISDVSVRVGILFIIAMITLTFS
ncbi:hypothetical protein IV203_018093 [Nitzschia inconspicua]|uniref:Uncharacterized protein n=1 Tax=Nitzschia inconspicua TaxID=303405 RepID=A0A9K3Q621_9STRA|nr:hypothetical protein IV203_018093 [Nitzschia inconspicua]